VLASLFVSRKKTTTEKRGALISVTVGVRCHERLLAMLDEYRRGEPDIPTRASALRRLAIAALKSQSRNTVGRTVKRRAVEAT
jgi:hypothetical protein